MTVSRSASTGWSTTTRRWATGGRYSLEDALASPAAQRRAQGSRPRSSAHARAGAGARRRGPGRDHPARHVLRRRRAAPQAARADAGRRRADPVPPRRRGRGPRERVPARPGGRRGRAARGARRRPRHARRGREAPPAAALGGRAHPPRRGRGPRLLRRARGDRRRRPRGQGRAPARASWRSTTRPRRRQLLRPAARLGRATCSTPPRRRCATPTCPHSHFQVGAALRAADGGIHAGANVENAAYPQSQCAEASAIGAMVAAGEREIAAVAVVAEQMDVCPPCGGCRQRLSEFARPGHAGLPRPVAHDHDLGELLPLSFGASTHELARGRQAARRARRPRAARRHRARLRPRRGGRRGRGRHGRSRTRTCPASREPSVAGHAGRAVAGRIGDVPVAVLQGRAHLYEGGDLDLIRTPVRALQGGGRRDPACSPTPPARCAPTSARAG